MKTESSVKVTYRAYPSESDHKTALLCRYEAQIAELEELARKRFWTLEPEDHLRARFSVKDQLGRTLYGPAFPASLRGFFQGLSSQA